VDERRRGMESSGGYFQLNSALHLRVESAVYQRCAGPRAKENNGLSINTEPKLAINMQFARILDKNTIRHIFSIYATQVTLRSIATIGTGVGQGSTK